MVMRGMEVQPLVAQFAEERDATAVFSGDGGDMLFFHGWPQLAVIDYAYDKGLDTHLLKLACAAALPAQRSVWRLICDAALYGVLGRRWDVREVLFEHYRLLSRDVVEAAWGDLDFLNPWNAPAEGIPPGKKVHAFSTTRPALFRDPLASQPQLDIINPLVCQPVVELCLRIPTWIHAAGGRDRAVERDAFAGDLPTEIVSRTWKGGADQHQDAMLASNIRLVRELLLDGELVKRGILDRKRVEACLSGALTRHKAHATEVFGYFCTEAWLLNWTSRCEATSASAVRA
jgi:asparagine synthase (glutamine-hydrolysing)